MPLDVEWQWQYKACWTTKNFYDIKKEDRRKLGKLVDFTSELKYSF